MLERLCLSIDRLHACQPFASRCEGRKKVSGSRGPFVQARAHEARWWFEAGGSGSRGRWTGWRVQLVGHVPRQKLVDKMEPGVAGVLIRLHYYPLEVILTCVRWYVAYPPGLPTFFCEPGGTRVLPGVISKDRSSITAYPRR